MGSVKRRILLLLCFTPNRVSGDIEEHVFILLTHCSPVQKAQMVTAAGDTLVLAVEGDFDACQAIVKDILHNVTLKQGTRGSTCERASCTDPRVVFQTPSHSKLWELHQLGAISAAGALYHIRILGSCAG